MKRGRQRPDFPPPDLRSPPPARRCSAEPPSPDPLPDLQPPPAPAAPRGTSSKSALTSRPRETPHAPVTFRDPRGLGPANVASAGPRGSSAGETGHPASGTEPGRSTYLGGPCAGWEGAPAVPGEAQQVGAEGRAGSPRACALGPRATRPQLKERGGVRARSGAGRAGGTGRSGKPGVSALGMNRGAPAAGWLAWGAPPPPRDHVLARSGRSH